MQKRLVLASGSPRRKELLAGVGLSFDVIVANVDETIASGTNPVEAVQDLAYRKAKAVANTLSDGLVLGADTIVVHQGQILGKPSDEEAAKTMLASLSGSTHTVYTGISLIEVNGGRELHDYRSTEVEMKQLTPEEISAYVATGEPMDKAGAYGIQGLAAPFVTEIRGDYYAVVGLPLALVVQRLAEFGWNTLPRRAED